MLLDKEKNKYTQHNQQLVSNNSNSINYRIQTVRIRLKFSFVLPCCCLVGADTFHHHFITIQHHNRFVRQNTQWNATRSLIESKWFNLFSSYFWNFKNIKTVWPNLFLFWLFFFFPCIWLCWLDRIKRNTIKTTHTWNSETRIRQLTIQSAYG